MDRYEPLHPPRRPAALHCPFTFSEWQVAVLSAIIQSFVEPMFDSRRNLAFGSCHVASSLKDFIQNDPILINRTPQPELTALNRYNNFVQISPG